MAVDAGKQYDASQVTVIRGDTVITDFAEGDMVSFQQTNDQVTAVVDAQGNGSFAKSNDTRGTITVNLLLTSPALPLFVAEANSSVIKPLKIKIPLPDGSTETVGGENAMVTKKADGTLGTSVPTRAFTFSVLDYQDNVA
ncbi:MAG: hypothetical protein ABF969_04250 [Sporolactobacillus sp.]